MTHEEIAPWLEKEVFATLTDGSRVRFRLASTNRDGLYLATAPGPLRTGMTQAVFPLNARDIVKIEPAGEPEQPFDSPSETALFGYMEAQIASLEGKYQPGSLQYNALERYKGALTAAREISAKFKTVRGRVDFRGNTQSGVVRFMYYLMLLSLVQVRSFDSR
jgi:hypothetical protein